MATIEFIASGSSGETIIVDDSDWEAVRQHKWFACIRHNSFTKYAQARIIIDGKRKMTYLHRYLMQPSPGQVVDHIDGNALNNSRSNLRIVSQSENQKAARSLPGRYEQERKEVWRQVVHTRQKNGTVRTYVYDRKTRERLEPEPHENIIGKTIGKTV